MPETRRALIVANSNYQDAGIPDLASPARDARELARVLGDLAIGNFEVAPPLLNATSSAITQAIEKFFVVSGPRLDDLLLLYFSGHGITDEEGHLYLAAADTQLVRNSVLHSTAVAADFIDRTMRRSRSRRQVLVLDCCRSGAFAEGMLVKSVDLPALDEPFKAVQGKGRVILTASTGTQFAQAGPRGASDQPSLYTRFFVEGLETGEADRGDGEVDVDELHDYLVGRLGKEAPYQTPTKSGYVEGKPLYIARTKVVRPAELPEKLQHALDDPEIPMRLWAVAQLEELLRGDHPGKALAARLALVGRRDKDDSFMVRKAAARCLDAAETPKPEGAATPAGPALGRPNPPLVPVGQTSGSGADEGTTTRGKTWWTWTGEYLRRAPVRAAICVVMVAAVGTWQLNQWRSNHFPGKSSPQANQPADTQEPAKSAAPAPTGQNQSAPSGSPASPPDVKNADPNATAKRTSSVSTAPVPNFSSISTPPIPKPDSKTAPYVNPKDNLTYLWIPPGKFDMGSSPGDSECYPDEKPQQKDVQISGFWLGKTDVTQAAWNKVGIAANPSHFKGDDLPVDSVDWNEAYSYCKEIGGRLPTEKEWEYAARAGTTGPRYGTIDDIAWYSVNSGQTTHPVGKKQANAFKLYDMLGNVYQWTATDWGPYPGGTADDCKGCKVLRGGSWFDYAGVVRASNRERSVPTSRDSDSGFRCVGEFR
jgi:formylglycine-generating enzyme required for sulfatase activity/uncharacterized caspase-like protein